MTNHNLSKGKTMKKLLGAVAAAALSITLTPTPADATIVYPSNLTKTVHPKVWAVNPCGWDNDDVRTRQIRGVTYRLVREIEQGAGTRTLIYTATYSKWVRPSKNTPKYWELQFPYRAC